MSQAFKIIFLFFLVCFLGCFGFLVLTKAGTGENTTGYAWSENIGWVSFNSTDPGAGGGASYGVQIDPATGNFSGYAWSENIGWISFNRADTGNPPAPPFNGGSGPIAKYNSNTGVLTGWMWVLANGGGWDGWIRFCDSGVANCSGADQIAKIVNGDWHGWAWSSSGVGTGIGWLSLNSADPGAGGSAYKITSNLNQPPIASNLQVSGNEYYCQTPARHIFSWVYSGPEPGDTQSKFQLQIDTEDQFLEPRQVDLTVENDSTSQQIPVYDSSASNQLVYNTFYHWRIKVWDSQGAESNWVIGTDFTTELHRYPSVNFNPIPASPSVEEEVLLDNLSQCYDINNDPIPCPANAWLWTIPPSAVYKTGSSPSSEEPIVIFNSSGGNPVTLQVTDTDNNTCTLTKTINVGIKLPWWKEVLPW